MKEIFKNIEGREWDWNGLMVEKVYRTEFTFASWSLDCGKAIATHLSLADFLANKSWCKAVWGEWDTRMNGTTELPKNGYIKNSTKSFQILQQEGKTACLEYIKKTML